MLGGVKDYAIRRLQARAARESALLMVDTAWQDQPMFSLLLYDYVVDVLERRAPFRDQHLALVLAAHEQGALQMAGALADPVDGAVFVFATDDRSVVEDFVTNDPYVQEGLVTSWRIRPWNVVVPAG